MTGKMDWEVGEEEGNLVEVDWEGELEEGWGELEEVGRGREDAEEDEVGGFGLEEGEGPMMRIVKRGGGVRDGKV